MAPFRRWAFSVGLLIEEEFLPLLHVALVPLPRPSFLQGSLESYSVVRRQRKLGSHTPPCHRRMVITTLSSVLLAALQRRPVLYHTRWLLAVHWHWSSGHWWCEGRGGASRPPRSIAYCSLDKGVARTKGGGLSALHIPVPHYSTLEHPSLDTTIVFCWSPVGAQ